MKINITIGSASGRAKGRALSKSPQALGPTVGSKYITSIPSYHYEVYCSTKSEHQHHNISEMICVPVMSVRTFALDADRSLRKPLTLNTLFIQYFYFNTFFLKTDFCIISNL